MALLSRQAEKLRSRLDLSRLKPRPRTALGFLDDRVSVGRPILLDTGVYIHQLKNKTPPAFAALVRTRQVHHSAVAIQEMLHTIGVLDPADGRTRANVAAIEDLLAGC